MYFHGSPKNIKGKYLLPRPSAVLENEKAVFATNFFEFAALFAANFTDWDIHFGVHNGRFFIIEQYPNAFDILKKSAWIYTVKKEHFHDDDRLGLRGFEFISPKRVPIEKKIFVKNIYKELRKKKSIINFITFNQKIKALEPLMKKKGV